MLAGNAAGLRGLTVQDDTHSPMSLTLFWQRSWLLSLPRRLVRLLVLIGSTGTNLIGTGRNYQTRLYDDLLAADSRAF